MHSLVLFFCVDFFIQLVGYIFAYSFQTEKFYDVTGSVTYILLVVLSLLQNEKYGNRQLLLTTLVTIWAVRLGLFLLYRVLLNGGDRRFNKVKTKPLTFFIYWMIQGLWIYITLLPTLIANQEQNRKELSNCDYIGLCIWIVGFLFEVLADYQKFSFKSDPNNVNKFIDSGLWSWSRHPNYFGEIVLWIGIFVIASNVLHGWKWLSIVSPMFVYYLLCYVSGIPILERQSMKRYGHLDMYKHYVRSVPVLVPFVGSP